jgi:hypothetical protein
VAESSVNKIIWAQAGRVTEPGRYLFKFGWLTVTAEDLGVWKQYPNAAFTLLRTAPAEGAEDEFRLGAFELREICRSVRSETRQRPPGRDRAGGEEVASSV